MGYILKIKDRVKLFYSKPVFGYYSNSIIALSIEEYREYSKDDDCDDFIYMEGWCDVSASVNTEFSFGLDITDTFILECITQQKQIEENKPYSIQISI